MVEPIFHPDSYGYRPGRSALDAVETCRERCWKADWVIDLKEGRALRTETVISDTRDFGIGRRVNAENWKAVRAVGENANRRLCDAQAQDARPAPDVATLTQVTRPSKTSDGLHAPALCFGDPRVMALLTTLVCFSHLLNGLRNR